MLNKIISRNTLPRGITYLEFYLSPLQLKHQGFRGGNFIQLKKQAPKVEDMILYKILIAYLNCTGFIHV